jgi:D-arabinose 5-phosphate isomerase GutQ
VTVDALADPESLAPTIYVYGFCAVPNGAALTLPEGMTHPLTLMQTGQLGAIAETHLDIAALKDDDQQLIAAILSHDRVLQAVFEQVPVLPLRFGTQFVHPQALAAHLQAHQADYLAQLSQLADQAEYLLKLTPQEMTAPPPSDTLTGRDYFLAKKQRLQAQTAHQQAQQQQLEALLAHLEQVHGKVVLSPAQANQQRLQVLADRQPDWIARERLVWEAIAPTWQIDCSGPLPPYHFATSGQP